MSTRPATTTVSGLVLFVVLGLATLLAGCTGGPDTDLPALEAGNLYDTVSQAQRDAGSYHFTTSSRSGLTASVAGEGDVSLEGDRTSVRATLSGEDGEAETVLVDGVWYLRAPGIGDAEQPWQRLDQQPVDDQDGGGFGDEGDDGDDDQLAGRFAAAADPGRALAALEDPVDFEVVGSEEVDGVTTNRYRLGVAPARLFAALGFPAEVADLPGLPQTYPYDVWVDEDGLPRRSVVTLSVAGRQLRTELTFTAYGENVVIEAPAAELVAD